MWRVLIIGVLAVALGMPGRAAAQEERWVPSGRFGFAMGVRQGLGQLGEDFGIGGVGGIEAGYHPSPVERRFSLGLHWSVLWSWFGSDDIASVAGSLTMLELGAGLRLRMVIATETPRFLTLGGGVNLLRTNVPIEACADRNCLGPYLSLGTEHFVFDTLLLGIDGRYIMLPDGPSSIAVVFSVSFGT